MSRQKKVFALVIGILVAANALFVTCKQPTSSGGKTVRVTHVTLDQDEITLAIGTMDSLIATVWPKNASNKNVEWSSSNEGVATVENGIVTAVALGGPITITAKAKDGGEPGFCTVYVVEGDPVSGIKLNASSLTLYKGFNAPLVVTIEPPTAANKNVRWESSNEAAATVSETGVVTAVAKGSATIKVTSREDAEISTTCNVTVENDEDRVNPVENVTLSETGLIFEYSSGAQSLRATVTPAEADDTVMWFSTNPAVAAVSPTSPTSASTACTVTPGIAGSAIIIVTTKDGGKMAVCAVTVKGPPGTTDPDIIYVTGITLNTNALDLVLDPENTVTATLIATLTPEDSTTKAIRWETTNTAIATVSGGTVTAKKAGTAVITARTSDGGYTAVCAVTVSDPPAQGELPIIMVTDITLNKKDLTLTVGDVSEPLTYTLTPSNPTNPNVTWRSTKPDVATVSQTGVVRALKAGTTVIMVTAASNGINDICEVEVKAVVIPATGITLDAEEITIHITGSDRLYATVLPPGANQDITWTVTRGSEFIEVNNGTITGKGVEGEATVRAAVTSNPIHYLECDVIVVDEGNAVQVTGVRLAPSSLTLDVGESTTMVEIVEPPEARSRSVSWSVEPQGTVVSVNNRGVVTALAPGTATITVKTTQNEKTATSSVRVRAPTEINIPVTGVTLDKAALILKRDAPPTNLKATVYPSIATTKDLQWFSTDETVVMVQPDGDEEGTVMVVDYGSALIYVTTVSSGKVAVCMVTVSDSITGGATEVIIKQDGEAASTVEMLTTDDPVTLTASVVPSTVSQNVTWASMNPRIVTVVNGVVTPVSAGFGIITATAGNGVMAACGVIVNNPPPSIIYLDYFTLVPDEIELKIGESIAPYVRYEPFNTTERGVIWTSDNGNVATVDGNGTITAKGYGPTFEDVYGNGIATITATSAVYSNIKTTMKVTVTRSAVFTISFDQISDGALPEITGKTLSMKATEPVVYTLSNAQQYSAIHWVVEGTDDVIESDIASLSLEAEQFVKYGLGFFTVALEVKKVSDGKWYSKNITLELVE